MKRTLFILSLCSVFALGANAQKQTRTEYTTTTTTAYENAQARIPEVYVQPRVAPLVCEVEIIPGATNSFSTTMSKQKVEKDLNGNLENVRMYAVYLFTEKTNSDMIVAATYHIQSQNDGSYVVDVKGFPARFTNWHTATKDDYEWMRITDDQSAIDRTYKPTVKQ